MTRSKWVTPKLISKPVSQTASGIGINLDGLNGEIQS
jgi:hypothetical protein